MFYKTVRIFCKDSLGMTACQLKEKKYIHTKSFWKKQVFFSSTFSKKIIIPLSKNIIILNEFFNVFFLLWKMSLIAVRKKKKKKFYLKKKDFKMTDLQSYLSSESKQTLKQESEQNKIGRIWAKKNDKKK